MIQFGVGVIVGAALVALLVIVIGPSRKVRAEGPLPPDVEAKLLLGEDPDQAPAPEPSNDHPRQYTPNELAALQRLGQQQPRKRKR